MHGQVLGGRGRGLRIPTTVDPTLMVSLGARVSSHPGLTSGTGDVVGVAKPALRSVDSDRGGSHRAEGKFCGHQARSLELAREVASGPSSEKEAGREVGVEANVIDSLYGRYRRL